MSVFSVADNLIYELCVSHFGDGYITCILAGDYGLITMTPAYLMLFLFPVMFVFTLLQLYFGEILSLKNLNVHNSQSSVFSPACAVPLLSGFGCTTASLAMLSNYDMRRRLACSVLLCVTIPCSAQTAVIVAVSSLVGLPYMLLYFVFLLTVFFLLSFALNIFILKWDPPIVFRTDLPSQSLFGGDVEKYRQLTKYGTKKKHFTLTYMTNRKISAIKYIAQYIHLRRSFLTSLKYTKTTALPFALGSLLVSTLMYFDFFASVCALASPVTEDLLLLPREATSIFVLSMIKRDLGAAGLLSVMSCGSFTPAEMTVTLIILTLFVPCFSSFIILIKQEQIKTAGAIWLFSMTIALVTGKIASLLIL